jgi:uncharacterized membrane protein
MALCSAAHAPAQPRIDLTATPSWNGWSRPGRSTEVDIRVSSDAAARATLLVTAGLQSARAELDLQPGRVERLHLPVAAADALIIDTASAAAPSQRLELGIAYSESPLLGVALATNERVGLEGFQSVALSAGDLPRHASAYSSVDALMLDAATLGALDPAQLGALLAHAAACGRIAVINTDARVRKLLAGAAGCGGQALLDTESVAEARDRLAASLSKTLPSALPYGVVGELVRPQHVVWGRVAAALGAYFAAAVLALAFWPNLPALVLTPAVAAALVLALLKSMQPPSPLLVWSEAASGMRLASYQAWQRFEGVARERARVPIPPQLASAVQACAPAQAMRFDFDVARGQASAAEFDTRLFHQMSLCYSGSFPIIRALSAKAGADGSHRVRNEGTHAWPRGLFLADGAVHVLPALDPAAVTTLDAQAGTTLRDAVVRTALTRLPTTGGRAALWELELGGVAGAPDGSRGWLLMSVPSP